MLNVSNGVYIRFEDLRIQPARRVWTKEGLRDNGGDTGDTSSDAGMDKSVGDTSLYTSTPRQVLVARYIFIIW